MFQTKCISKASKGRGMYARDDRSSKVNWNLIWLSMI